MYSITCPVCNNTTFSPDEETFAACFNCGTVFSGKQGKSKRQNERVKKDNRFTITFKGNSYKAQIVDISENGLSIQISGNPEVSVGDTLNFFLGPQKITSKVVRKQQLSDRVVIGLEKLG